MATRQQQHQQQQRGTQSRQEEERSQAGPQRMSSGAQQQPGGQRQTGLSQQQQTGLSQRSHAMPGLVISPFISPFSFMRRFGQDMEQLFNDFGSSGMMLRGMSELADWTPQIEVFRREGQLIIRADLPGLNKDDVRVEVRDDAVVIQGERQEEHREEREGLYTTERTYGRFYREIPLPEGVNTSRATASFRDGVLEIAMPAEKSETRGHQLEIQDSRSTEQQQGKQQARAAGAGR